MATSPTFHPFPRLPTELRLKIWNASIAPRTVRILWSFRMSECITPDIPIILHINHESRTEGLSIYEKGSFKSTQNFHIALYYNQALDTAYIDWKSFTKNGCSDPGSRVIHAGLARHYSELRSLQIDDAISVGREDAFKIKFPRLQQLFVSKCRNEDRFSERNALRVENGVESKMMPRLGCLDGGDQCLGHSWFDAWNEWVEGKSGSWWKAYMMRLRLERGLQHYTM